MARRKTNEYDILAGILNWENGLMTARQERVFFQKLVNTKLAWKLQGCYGRRAQQLIDEGRVKE